VRDLLYSVCICACRYVCMHVYARVCMCTCALIKCTHSSLPALHLPVSVALATVCVCSHPVWGFTLSLPSAQQISLKRQQERKRKEALDPAQVAAAKQAALAREEYAREEHSKRTIAEHTNANANANASTVRSKAGCNWERDAATGREPVFNIGTAKSGWIILVLCECVRVRVRVSEE
jgi:hypothetical protein